MSAERFLDSNILLYQLDRNTPEKQHIANELVLAGIRSGNACISFQVAQECLNAGLRKAAIPFSHEQAHRYLQSILTPLWTIMPSPRLLHRCLEIQQRYGFSFYDSQIVAAALQGDCRELLSEDLQHGQTIERLTIVNPFL